MLQKILDFFKKPKKKIKKDITICKNCNGKKIWTEKGSIILCSDCFVN